MVKRQPLTQTQAWEALKSEYERIKNDHMATAFEQEPDRFERYSLQWGEMLLDFSKNRIDQPVFENLMALVHEIDLNGAIEELFNGTTINFTEQRPALHMALRNLDDEPIYLEGENVSEDVNEVLEQMKQFANKVRSGEWKGHTGKPVTDVVHLGIGGSHLGPEMACEALKPYWAEGLQVHFVANIDGTDVQQTLKQIDPETTLFIIASKSFTTQETLTNAHTIRQWFLEQGFPESAIADHFVAVSTNTEGVKAFGIDPENMFRFWDWVGGRFSSWSAIGLPIACMIGFDKFREFLEGGNAMDLHFRATAFEENLPVVMALLSIWYANFFETATEAILPYEEHLHRFPAYLQQLTMESNGKRITEEGKSVNYATQPIVWGDRGTNGQHSFFQLLHHGTHIVPCTFLTTIHPHHPYKKHHELLVANCFAQSEALMVGKDFASVEKEMKAKGFTEEEVEDLAPHRVFPGNQPSNTLVMKQLNPYNLGALMAMYEHKVFVEGIVWNIDSFDQWGVELGKNLAKNIAADLKEPEKVGSHDASTNGLINVYKEERNKD